MLGVHITTNQRQARHEREKRKTLCRFHIQYVRHFSAFSFFLNAFSSRLQRLFASLFPAFPAP